MKDKSLYGPVAARTQPATPELPVMLDGVLLEPLTVDQVFRAMRAAGPMHASTVRSLARYWKTHPAVAATPAQQGEPQPFHNLRAHMLFSRRKALADRYGFELTEQLNSLIAAVVEWAQAEILATPPAQPESALLIDGMTPAQFIGAELFEFQQATGCDTAAEFKAQPTPVVPATTFWLPPLRDGEQYGSYLFSQASYAPLAGWKPFCAATPQPEPLTPKD